MTLETFRQQLPLPIKKKDIKGTSIELFIRNILDKYGIKYEEQHEFSSTVKAGDVISYSIKILLSLFEDISFLGNSILKTPLSNLALIKFLSTLLI